MTLTLKTFTASKSAAEKSPYQRIFMRSSKTEIKTNWTLKTVILKTVTLKSNSFFDGPEDCYLKILLRLFCNIFSAFLLELGLTPNQNLFKLQLSGIHVNIL